MCEGAVHSVRDMGEIACCFETEGRVCLRQFWRRKKGRNPKVGNREGGDFVRMFTGTVKIRGPRASWRDLRFVRWHAFPRARFLCLLPLIKWKLKTSLEQKLGSESPWPVRNLRERAKFSDSVRLGSGLSGFFCMVRIYGRFHTPKVEPRSGGVERNLFTALRIFTGLRCFSKPPQLYKQMIGGCLTGS